MRRVLLAGLCACASSSPPQVQEPPSPVVVPSEVGAVELPSAVVGRSLKSGETTIVPNDLDRVDLPVGTRVAGRFQLCVDDTGKPISVAIVNSTSLANYDRKIVSRLRAWMFDPIVVDAKAVKVCTMLTVVYEQTTPVRVERR